MQEKIFHHTFDNGLTVVAQPMPWLESAAFSIATPAGFRYDPSDKLGLANLACEMVQRGSGDLSSREWVEALDMLGVDCLLYTSPSPRDQRGSRMPSSA